MADRVEAALIGDRECYDGHHRAFADSCAAFVQREVVPYQRDWEAAGAVAPEAYRKAGDLGIVGLGIPEQYGGGQAPFSFNCVVTEQVAYALSSFGALRAHMDVVAPYVVRLGSPEQRERWLPGMADGSTMASIAMTEPEAGSDLAGISTSLHRSGDGWVLSGAKTFITGGWQSNLIIVVARSERQQNRRAGLTLAVVEGGMAGFTRGQPQRKLGLHAQDITDLYFDEVQIPVENILGEPGRAFEYLGQNLPQERLSIAVNSQAQAVAALRDTIGYVQHREMFGTTLSAFQNTKFVLGGLAAKVSAGQALIDRAIRDHDRGSLGGAGAAGVKLFTTELHNEVVDTCLQLFGGSGYLYEQAICRQYADARVARIYGGTSEVMKSIIAKSLGL